MYIITVEKNFASAHQLRGYQGKCENIHGHNWKVIVSVKGTTLNDIGLLLDFNDLKRIVEDVTAQLDHKNINEVPPFTEINPSSENIARYITNAVDEKLQSEFSGIVVDSVTVWESDTSRCTYIPDKN